MAEFDFNELMFEKCIDGALLAGAILFEEISKDNTPRNIDDLPIHNINRKDGKKPKRNVGKLKGRKQKGFHKFKGEIVQNKHYYRPPVKINGNWYEGVTGDLKRSIGVENTGYLEYSVGVMEGPTEIYAYTQEFGDPARGIPRRSFLNEPFKKHKKEIEAQIQKTFKELLDKYEI